MERTKPTLKQARFAKAYAVVGNATEAAVVAGYNVKSRTVAAAIGKENLQNPLVQREVEHWQARLERNIMPSLQTVENWRDQTEDPRISFAAARDLLNRAGVGKHIEGPRNVVAVFSQMDESSLMEKMAKLTGQNIAMLSDKAGDASHTIQCATPEKSEGVPGSESPAAK